MEQVRPTGNTKEEILLAPSILLDFWVKVTPATCHSCLVNLIDVILACEDAYSKLVEVVTVAVNIRIARPRNAL